MWGKRNAIGDPDHNRGGRCWTVPPPADCCYARRSCWLRLEEILAGYLIILLVLIPYFAFRVLDEVLGEGRLVRMFFVEREAMKPK